MKLSKSLLSAILIGITVQATSCTKDENLPQPDSEKETNSKTKTKVPDNCPGCGMG